MAIADQLEALRRRIDDGGLPDPAIAERAEREAARAALQAELDIMSRRRGRIAADWLAQLAVVSAAVDALVEANIALARIAELDDTAYHAMWQIGSGRPSARLPGALDLPSLPAVAGRSMTLAGQVRALRAEVER